MSRIGNAPIIIPESVTTVLVDKSFEVSGPKGKLSLDIPSEITVEVQQDQITLKRKNDLKKVKALHGLTRSLVANIVTGLTEGWTKNLELHGVGFRAQVNGNKLILNVGYSHPVEIAAPSGVTFEVSDNTKIKVSGIDKQLVGQVAANIKKVRPPDVYKGKGIRYQGEYIRKKVGKSAKVGAGATGGGK